MTYTPDGVDHMDDLESSFITNTTSTHLVTSPLLPVLNRGDRKKVVRITTTVGSITVGTKDKVFPVPAHKVSKAAQNMLTVQYAQSFADEECTFVAVSGSSVDLEVDASANAVMEIVSSVGMEENGNPPESIHGKSGSLPIQI
ncbi:hypothetical protein EYZ11_005584 [Aspergillus tanneri]|uniref:Uncharacterized protein n=1 Tax=Aspergillus tanneri TaxID=1220188 RepID=A0A4S3JI65_9EURO|nr:hypothetical protein EYZ11_005584 [Aspergillus tanneri]